MEKDEEEKTKEHDMKRLKTVLTDTLNNLQSDREAIMMRCAALKGRQKAAKSELSKVMDLNEQARLEHMQKYMKTFDALFPE